MSTPLWDAVQQYHAKQAARFHTPGHKAAPQSLSFIGAALGYDVTELPMTDSLLMPQGSILQAEQAAAGLFGTAETLFSAGGCTLCIQTMLRLVFSNGGKLVLGRNCHVSALNALALMKIEPVWVWPEPDAGAALPGRISADALRKVLQMHPDAKAVYITSPDYYGVCSDLQAIGSVCEAFSIPMLVDNAHGTHLAFVAPEMAPLACGAAMCADSAHKTLPVLTGGAYLQIAQEQYAAQAKAAMAMFASTSPSYLILLSLDLCRDWLEREGRMAFAALRQQVEAVQQEAIAQGLTLPEGRCDPVRLTLSGMQRGIGGTVLAAHFRAYGIEPEYADTAQVVLIPSPFNTARDFERLTTALHHLPDGVLEPQSVYTVPMMHPQAAMTPAEALCRETEQIPLRLAMGRIAAAVYSVCPPGVPLAIPGERLEEGTLSALDRQGYHELKVVK